MTYKVLIVDDSKLARMAAIKALNDSHPMLKRVEAGNAAEAMKAMEGGACDIALVDFNMPQVDGLHLVADLRALKPKMPIAVISANHQKEVIARAEALRATFLPKPLSDQALAQFLEAALQSLREAAP
jgi:DNA-binding NarL/FixJ family response regulator